MKKSILGRAKATMKKGAVLTMEMVIAIAVIGVLILGVATMLSVKINSMSESVDATLARIESQIIAEE